MANYYVNKNAGNNGEHEVHEVGCLHMPDIDDKEYLGSFPNCVDAVIKAKKIYPAADGCGHCSNECYAKLAHKLEKLRDNLPIKCHEFFRCRKSNCVMFSEEEKRNCWEVKSALTSGVEFSENSIGKEDKILFCKNCLYYEHVQKNKGS